MLWIACIIIGALGANRHFTCISHVTIFNPTQNLRFNYFVHSSFQICCVAFRIALIYFEMMEKKTSHFRQTDTHKIQFLCSFWRLARRFWWGQMRPRFRPLRLFKPMKNTIKINHQNRFQSLSVVWFYFMHSHIL